jgi:hypothetical protein
MVRPEEQQGIAGKDADLKVGRYTGKNPELTQ